MDHIPRSSMRRASIGQCLLALVGVLLVLTSGTAFAQEVCYRWYKTLYFPGPEYFGSLNAIHAARIAQRNASPATGGAGVGQYTTVYTVESCSSSAPTGTTGSRSCTYSSQRQPVGSGACSGSGGTVNCAVFGGLVETYDYGVDPAGCPDEACDVENADVGTKFTAANVSGPNEYCNAVTQCKMKVLARTGETMTIHHTDEDCGEVGASPGQPEDGAPETCEVIGDGEYCASASGDGQCGYLNDTYVCLKSVKSDECKVVSGGARVCGPAASTTPPVPDNGTPGQVATPDEVIPYSARNPVTGSTSTTNYNYYGAATVSASSRDPGTDGGTPDGGSPGAGGSEGDGPDNEAVEGALGAEAGGSIPDTETDMSEALDEGLLSWGVGAACPAPPTVTFFGTEYTYDAISWLCLLAEMLSGLVVAMAYVGAVAIMFSR